MSSEQMRGRIGEHMKPMDQMMGQMKQEHQVMVDGSAKKARATEAMRWGLDLQLKHSLTDSPCSK